MTVRTNSPIVMQKPPAKDSIAVDTEMPLQPEEIASDCSISLDTTRKAHKVRQASTLSETCRARTTSHTRHDKVVLYILHMQCPDAKHQNMAGVIHPVSSDQELLHKVIQADANSPLEYSTDISQAMRDTVSPDGPSPAITIGNDVHWRLMLISTRRKHDDFVDLVGTGFLHSVRTSIHKFY